MLQAWVDVFGVVGIFWAHRSLTPVLVTVLSSALSTSHFFGSGDGCHVHATVLSMIVLLLFAFFFFFDMAFFFVRVY